MEFFFTHEDIIFNELTASLKFTVSVWDSYSQTPETYSLQACFVYLNQTYLLNRDSIKVPSFLGDPIRKFLCDYLEDSFPEYSWII